MCLLDFRKKDVKLKGTFEIIGKQMNIANDKEFFSKVEIKKLN